jgi:hypothetical protein
MKSCFLLFFCFVAWMQQTHAQFDSNLFNKERSSINKKGMIVLGAWSAANIVSGGIGAASSNGTAKYFHQMNLAWGVINGSLAGLGIWGGAKNGHTLSLGATIQAQHKVEKLFLINVGLDLAYIGTGIWLNEKSKTATKKPERLQGFGNSLIMQGGFLLLFDGIMYAIHSRHGSFLNKKLDNISIAAGPLGFSAVVKL